MYVSFIFQFRQVRPFRSERTARFVLAYPTPAQVPIWSFARGAEETLASPLQPPICGLRVAGKCENQHPL